MSKSNTIQRILKNVLSLKFKFVIITILGFLLLSISLIQYGYYVAKTEMINQIKLLVKNTTINAYNDMKLTFELVEKGQMSVDSAVEVINLRYAGKLSKIFIMLDPSQVVSELQTTLDVFQIANIFQTIPKDGKYEVIIKDNSTTNSKEVFIKVDTSEFLLGKASVDNKKLKLVIDDNQLIQNFYRRFHQLSQDEKDIISLKYGFKFIRDFSNISNKIGADGYIWSITAIFPEWELPKTIYPDDYTLEKITERFNNNFQNFASLANIDEYKNKFGKTPIEQFNYIQNYMFQKNSKPLPIYEEFHPSLGFINVDNQENYVGERVGRQISVRKNGWYNYFWKNPTDKEARNKIVYLKLFEYSDINNPKVSLKWVIASGAYEDEAYAPIVDLRKKLFGISLGITGVAIFLVLLYFQYYVNRPLNFLLNEVRRVNDGDLTGQARIVSKDEIGYLAESFNKSVLSIRDSREKLKEYAENLEIMVKDRTKELELEKEKSDKLLLNILPERIAIELKEKGTVVPVLFDSVSILFSDFKGFTKIAEKMPPQKLVQILDSLFLQFDYIIERHQIEKLKTIGDSYMCAGGIPTRIPNHLVRICIAALEMNHFMTTTREIMSMNANSEFWEMRIGIHTGPVVAGVIGKNKFSFDIWGDTVNTASRMESSGTPGKVNISDTVYQQVNKYFLCEYRGKIEVKNKGALDMYFLCRIRPEYSKDVDGLVANSKLVLEAELDKKYTETIVAA